MLCDMGQSLGVAKGPTPDLKTSWEQTHPEERSLGEPSQDPELYTHLLTCFVTLAKPFNFSDLSVCFCRMRGRRKWFRKPPVLTKVSKFMRQPTLFLSFSSYDAVTERP